MDLPLYAYVASSRQAALPSCGMTASVDQKKKIKVQRAGCCNNEGLWSNKDVRVRIREDCADLRRLKTTNNDREKKWWWYCCTLPCGRDCRRQSRADYKCPVVTGMWGSKLETSGLNDKRLKK